VQEGAVLPKGEVPALAGCCGQSFLVNCACEYAEVNNT
jgi:hypothetical protein